MVSDEQLEALLRRVAALEGVASEYRLSIAATAQLKRERRYRLLQAAAEIWAAHENAGTDSVVREI